MESGFSAEVREKTVVTTRKSRDGCHYLGNSSLLTQPGFMSHGSGFLHKIMLKKSDLDLKAA